MWLYKLLETDLFPDFLIRAGIRHMLSKKVREESCDDWEKQQAKFMSFVQELRQSPIAIETAAANAQHYEVPSEFFSVVLGPHMKYSCAYWQPHTQSLQAAEEAMLRMTCERAQLEDGQDILELGCGWGSLSLWMAEHYPNAKVTAVSNSNTQKQWIDRQAARQGLANLDVITANMVDFDTVRQYDRVVSVEMFEHMKNYGLLMDKIERWLKPGGKLFVHIFTHPVFAYHYEDQDGTDWLTQYFFTGGTMPSNHLLLYFQGKLNIEDHWVLSGQHYQKTANAWLDNMLANQGEIKAILANTYGPNHTKRWWVYWKLFFLACAELWGYKKGQEWFVSHYRFIKG